MESHNTLHRDKGSQAFTLVEILIAIGILAILGALGLMISFDFYKSYAFNSEKNIIISVLQRARNQSINNINQVRHGVHFEDNSGLKYIMFECPAGTPQCTSYDSSYTKVEIASSWGISFSSPALPFDIVFDQLNGDCVSSSCQSSEVTITVSDGIKSYDIKVNQEGRISW